MIDEFEEDKVICKSWRDKENLLLLNRGWNLKYDTDFGNK
jgi:hypothetical protein